MKTTLKATLIATAIAAIPYGSHAAGLGAINVFSGLGQPLRAEIELSATPQELQALTAKVAGGDAFRQANLSYSKVMTGLRLTVEPRGERAVVKVVSDRPVNDPYLDLIVEINWATGRLHRGYTFLLDPVDVGSPARPTQASVAAPVVMTQVQPRPVSVSSTQTPGEYRVKRGDTLRGIAARYVPAGANLDQMLIALLRSNPAAFDDGNINRLRAGAILAIPDENAVRSLGASEARREIVAQAADFNAYRKRLAGAVAARPAVEDSAASQQSSGTIAPRVDPVRAPETRDRVEVSGSEGEARDRTRLARLEALEEELIVREKALAEANSRLAELEKTVRDLQRLVEMRNESFAQLQQQAAAATPAQPAMSAEPKAPPMEDMAKTAPAMPDAAAPAPAPTEPMATSAPVAEPSAPAEPAPAPMAAAPAAATPEPAPAPAAAPEPAPAPVAEKSKPAPAPASTPPAAPYEEPSFLDTLLEDPLLLAGGGGILALLLGYAGIQARRRRQAQEAMGALSAMSEYPSEAQSNFGVKGGQSVDTGSSSVLHSDFSQSGLSAIDADEGVDPVAEADVYMAYGRDAQAEEILLDALKTDVSRGAIYLKLLEIYAQRKSARQFESVATDFYSRTGGAGSDWDKAAAMGRALDPDNPLYSKDGAHAAGPDTQPGAAMPAEGLSEGSVFDEEPADADAVGDQEVRFEAPEAEGGDVEFELPAVESGSDEDFEPAATVAIGKGQMKFEDTWALPGQTEGEATDKAAAAVPAEEQKAASEEPDFAVLDFDLGLDAEPAASSAPARKSEPEPEPEPAQADSFGLETSTETSLSGDADQAGMSATVINSDAFYSGDDGEAEPESALEVGGPAEPEQDESLDATVFNNDLLNFEFDADEASPDEAHASPAAVDLSSIDLDLDLSEDAGVAQEVEAAPAVAQSDEGAGAPDDVAPSEPDADQEADTKLDLARAYEEMGDKEGARELVEEVLREGNAEQQAAARTLMERLG